MKKLGVILSSVVAIAATTAIVFVSTISTNAASNYTTNSKGTIIVTGTFDGGGKQYGKNIGDGSQNESQPAVFELKKGAVLKNCVIVPPAGDGIHVDGNNTISNITFTDVGEDAISMRSSASGGTVTINNCTFNKADDKVLQVNKSSTWNLNNITVNGAGKILRQNGGTTFAMTVNINGIKASNVKEAIVRSDSSACVVNWKNITCNLDKSKWFLGKLKVNAK